MYIYKKSGTHSWDSISNQFKKYDKYWFWSIRIYTMIYDIFLDNCSSLFQPCRCLICFNLWSMKMLCWLCVVIVVVTIIFKVWIEQFRYIAMLHRNIKRAIKYLIVSFNFKNPSGVSRGSALSLHFACEIIITIVLCRSISFLKLKTLVAPHMWL